MAARPDSPQRNQTRDGGSVGMKATVNNGSVKRTVSPPSELEAFGTPLGVIMSIETGWLFDNSPIPSNFPLGNWRELAMSCGRGRVSIDMITPKGVPESRVRDTRLLHCH